MGAALSGYLDTPVTDKEITDGVCKLGMRYGASTMQGWRVANEDAMSCLPDFTDDSALFAVYDGHGGPEVALYVAKYLPMLLKTQYNFTAGKIDHAFKEAFLAVDKQIVLEDTADELQTLAGTKADDDDEDMDDKLKECEELNEEAKMPLFDLLAKYKKKFAEAEAEAQEEEEFEGSGKGKKVKKDSENGDAAAAVVNGDTAPTGAGSESAEACEVDSPINGESTDGATAKSADDTDGADLGEETKVAEEGEEKGEDEEMEDSDYDEDDTEEDSEEGEGDEEEGSSEEESDDEAPADFDEREGFGSGTTACVAVVKEGVITVANVGDSRCVLCSSGVAKDLSEDHKPEDEVEKTRVEKAGGTITKDGRINGGLNLARALGDHQYKTNTELAPEEQMISPMPDIQTHTITKDDDFLLIACDGIWNVMTSEQAIEFIKEHLQEAKSEDASDKTLLSDIASKLLDTCMSPDTSGDGSGCDNMTCVIIMLNQDLSNFKEEELSKRKLDDPEGNPESKKSKSS